MFKRYLIAFALIAGLATPANAQAPGPWTKVGMLRCILDPSVGFIITGHESMQCSFAQSAGGPQAYEGAINMVGLDVISTAAGGVFEWTVFAPTTGTPAGALAGEYVDASGDLGRICRQVTDTRLALLTPSRRSCSSLTRRRSRQWCMRRASSAR